MSELFSKSNDGQIQQNGLIMSTDEVIAYLNTSNNAIGSLQYENAQLRKENKRLKERNDELEDELEESSAFIIEQREENKQLKKSEKINMEYAEQIVEENQKLRIAKNDLRIENEQLRKQIQNYEQLISNSYVGEEETLDGFVGKYVIWEDELQKYKNKNEMIDNG